ncbi:hypothetical protein NPIL_253681 [Nephila pilipes]|uniref:Uncharacterized protein n=1 Tax=Nephila pilipes TaxID=299642 RepID=A0A8X6MWP5_NEPPI|nr:hypothetical protein NPIL_253681 [Nephila pilipes]
MGKPPGTLFQQNRFQESSENTGMVSKSWCPETTHLGWEEKESEKDCQMRQQSRTETCWKGFQTPHPRHQICRCRENLLKTSPQLQMGSNTTLPPQIQESTCC